MLVWDFLGGGGLDFEFEVFMGFVLFLIKKPFTDMLQLDNYWSKDIDCSKCQPMSDTEVA